MSGKATRGNTVAFGEYALQATECGWITARQIEAARARLATGELTRLSELGRLDRHAFQLFLSLLSEALTVQSAPDEAVELQSSDGLLRISLAPLGAETHAEVATEAGVFAGRDHLISISRVEASA